MAWIAFRDEETGEARGPFQFIRHLVDQTSRVRPPPPAAPAVRFTYRGPGVAGSGEVLEPIRADRDRLDRAQIPAEILSLPALVGDIITLPLALFEGVRLARRQSKK